jgi:hypothetical protein
MAFVWVVVALACVWRLRAWHVAPGDILVLAPLLYIGFIAPTYIFSAFVPFQNHLASSGYRLVAQVTPPVILWLAGQSALSRATASTAGGNAARGDILCAS